MGAFQRQIGDMVELTPEGEKEIHKYKNNYADATKPLSSKERNWSAWDMGNLWIGMIVSIAVYQVASGLIVSGMSWAQALLTIVLGHTLVMIFAVVLGHFGTKYGLGYPMLSKMVFGSKGTVARQLSVEYLGVSGSVFRHGLAVRHLMQLSEQLFQHGMDLDLKVYLFRSYYSGQ